MKITNGNPRSKRKKEWEKKGGEKRTKGSKERKTMDTQDGSPEEQKTTVTVAETLWSDEKPQLLNYEWVRLLKGGGGRGGGAEEERRSGACDGQLHAAWACNCSL